MTFFKRGCSPFFFVPVLLSFLAIIGCNTPKKQVESPYKGLPNWSLKELHAQVEPGDIMLKHGYGTISRWISLTLKEEVPLSHCALVLAKTDSAITLLHSISGKLAEEDGVQTIKLKAFTKDVMEGSLILMRKKKPQDINQLLRNAKSLLSRNVAFDHDFNAKDTSELYCSEVIAHLLNKTYGNTFFELVPHGEGMIYTFNSLLNHDAFEVLAPNSVNDSTTF